MPNSNLKAMVVGTHHGVTAAHLQEYCDQFAWRYNHRAGDPFADLLADAARWPHAPKRALSELMAVQRPGGSLRNGESPHNRRLRREAESKIRAAVGSLCSLLTDHMWTLPQAVMTNA